MLFCNIASGSKGNCTYIGSDNTHLLVDAGISAKKIEEGLKKALISPSDITGILITHEHSDHVAGLNAFAKKYEVPVYATGGTVRALLEKKKCKGLTYDRFQIIKSDMEFTIGDINILPFDISHDSAEPVAYRMDSENKSIAVVTDLGCYNEYTTGHLMGLNILMLEANHDIRMLEAGPYPYYLKERVSSNKGHLSNIASARMLLNLLNDNLNHIILGHLSEENNYPDLARETIKAEITLSDLPYKGTDFNIITAHKDKGTDLIVA